MAPFLIADFALSKSAFGVLFSAMVLGTAMFAAFAGALTDRFGERRVLGVLRRPDDARAKLLAAAVENYVWLLVTMLLFGITYSAQPSAGTRAVMAWFTRDRAIAMSLRQTGVPLGGMIGALLLPFIALHFGGYRAALVFAAGVVLLPSFAMLTWYREPNAEPRPRKTSGSGGFLRSLVVVMHDRRILEIGGERHRLDGAAAVDGQFFGPHGGRRLRREHDRRSDRIRLRAGRCGVRAAFSGRGSATKLPPR